MRAARIFAAALSLTAALTATGAAGAGRVTACDTDVGGGGLNLMQALAGGGTVTFACPSGREIRITRKQVITRPTEIDGGGQVTLRADPNIPMFEAAPSAGTVTFREIGLTGAKNVALGGIFNGNAVSLRLFDVRVHDAGLSPGPLFGFQRGILIAANSIWAEDSSFRDNAGAILVAPELVIQRSTFRNNRGQPFMPNFIDEGGSALIEDCTFSANGVSIWRAGDLTIRRSLFASNAPAFGTFGGALAGYGRFTIEKSEFRNNRAPNGAAIWLSSGELSLRRVTFEGNVATGTGGAIGVSATDAAASIVVRYSHFRENQAGTGGAIGFLRAAGDRALDGYAVNFARNTASDEGGAISAGGAPVRLARAQFVDNSAGGVGGAVSGGAGFGESRLANALMVRNRAAAGGAYAGLRVTFVNATLADNSGGGVTLLADHAATASFVNTILARNAGGNCTSLPGPEGGGFIDEGHNVQFPIDDCGSGIVVTDPGLDEMYVPVPDSAVRFAGDNAVCLKSPVDARDVFGERRPQARDLCTIGAVENTIERHAIDKLRHSDEVGQLREFLDFLIRIDH